LAGRSKCVNREAPKYVSIATACPQLAKADVRALTRGSGYDPLRKLGVPKCCDAPHGFSNDVVGCDPRLEGRT
jgi:hypothetical protein